MKKALLAGAASLALAAMPALGVFAETPTNGTHDVTVGEVDQTVYEVDITWGDMTFDWKYNSEANTFNFKPAKSSECISAGSLQGIEFYDQVFYDLQNDKNLFSDSTCSTLTEGELSEGVTYYKKSYTNNIAVVDYTENGRVAVSASFAPEDSYNWVRGKIGYMQDTCTREEAIAGADCQKEYVDGFAPAMKVLPGGSGYAPVYLSNLYLEKISDPANPELITTADKIGTVTINITDGTN